MNAQQVAESISADQMVSATLMAAVGSAVLGGIARYFGAKWPSAVGAVAVSGGSPTLMTMDDGFALEGIAKLAFCFTAAVGFVVFWVVSES